MKEALWALSNVTASGLDSIRLFLEEPAIIDRILMLAEHPNLDIQAESIYILCNATTCGDKETLQKLVRIDNCKLLRVFQKSGLKFKTQGLL